LNHARPDTAVSVLRDVLTQQLGATEVRVLLANYQLTAVRPILDGDERVPLDHTAAGSVHHAGTRRALRSCRRVTSTFR